MLPGSLQVGATEDGRVSRARLVDVYVLVLPREELPHGGLVHRGGACPVSFVGLHLGEGVLDLLAVLVVLFVLPFFSSWAQVPGWM